jgi:hypothetical protein
MRGAGREAAAEAVNENPFTENARGAKAPSEIISLRVGAISLSPQFKHYHLREYL